jgi:HD-GYP domain-containing protein (c-di-GMP phosphodiesterase class II)
MVNDRPYRKAMEVDSAREELFAGRGKQFDPQLIDDFLGTDHRSLMRLAQATESTSVPTYDSQAPDRRR